MYVRLHTHTKRQGELLRFQVLTTAIMKVAVFWVVAPCSLVEVYRPALMMEAASTSETSVNFYQTTRSNNPEYSYPGRTVLYILILSIVIG
jgi:hypothetical protein